MNHDQPDKLNDLLRQWSENHSASDAELHLLRSRIVALCSEKNSSNAASLMLPPRHVSRWSIGLGVAAALLIGTALGLWMKPAAKESPVNTLGEVAAQLPLLPQNLRSDSERLCSEMLRLFPRELLWVAETPRGIEMGLAKDESPSTSPAPFVSLDVLVQSRSSRKQDWITRWNGRLIMQAETLVVLATPGTPAGLSSFTFWTLPLPDGTVAVDTLMGSTSADAGTISVVLPTGTWKEIASWKNHEEDVRILQIVETLRRDQKAGDINTSNGSPQI